MNLVDTIGESQTLLIPGAAPESFVNAEKHSFRTFSFTRCKTVSFISLPRDPHDG